MSNYNLLILVLGISLCASCMPETKMAYSGDATYCEIGGKITDDAILFVLNKKQIMGSDSSFTYEIMESDIARGFVYPFPFALPFKDMSEMTFPIHWRLAQYEFSATQPNPFDLDWILIHAYAFLPDENGLDRRVDRRSSVLYSATRGVLAIRYTTTHEGITLDNNVFLCGGRGVRPAEL